MLCIFVAVLFSSPFSTDFPKKRERAEKKKKRKQKKSKLGSGDVEEGKRDGGSIYSVL